jgi:hypothetical protein
VHSRGDVTTRVNVDVRQSLAERAPSHEEWSRDQREAFKQICGGVMGALGYQVPF